VIDPPIEKTINKRRSIRVNELFKNPRAGWHAS